MESGILDKFEEEDVCFLDINVMNNGENKIYVKDTNSGLYMNYSSFEPWYTKTAWIIALYERAFNFCTNVNLFVKQVVPIKKVLA